MSLEWGVLFIVLQLIYLEGILSIDNAAVLGAMVAHLPPRDPIPWPRLLRVLSHPVHRLLGGQRLAALKVGLLGAYLGRGSMLFLATWVVRNRWLLLLGGFYLIYLAVSHFSADAHTVSDTAGPDVRASRLGFWAVVLNVELADLAFSLDNVVAAVALSRDIWVVLLGVFLGIVTMRFAAGIFVKLIEREPMLEAAAYLLVLVIGLQLLVEELAGIHLTHAMKFAASLSVLAATLLYARVPSLRRAGQRLRWLRVGLVALRQGALLLASPAVWTVRGSRALASHVLCALAGRRGLTRSR
ncbi:MAG: tellurium resistance protein TerC [Armatimonadota bacterium]|nr:tellurium resistance protein TerC [Armatimonadota bacterium]